jgi:hypothetical protein
MAASEKKAVKLISAEGFEFLVDYDAACVSNTIKNMLNSQGKQHNVAKMMSAAGPQVAPSTEWGALPAPP